MKNKPNQPVVIAKIDPLRPMKGRVLLTGTIRRTIQGNYLEVKIDDGICGMNNCSLIVHHAVVWQSK